jgi:hypothetical protein
MEETMVRLTQATLACAALAASLWLGASATAETVTPRAVGCKLIRNAAQLQAMRNDLAGNYCLANDIDASSIGNFVPIGDGNNYFTGKLFGNGRAIRNLRIDSTATYVGLFGTVDNALIQDIGLVNVDIAGTTSDAIVGGLAGYVSGSGSQGEIRRVHVSGRVAATGDAFPFAGGIVGYADGLTLADSGSSAGVSGGYYAGGAIGYAFGGTISRVYATGPVTCTDCYAGGLIAFGDSTNVTLSYATGEVIAGNFSVVGGLAGQSAESTIQRSHSLGAVTTVTGYVGGLVGHVNNGGTFTEVYAAGRVAGGTLADVDGLVGWFEGTPPTVTNAYWDVSTSKQSASAAGTGYTTAQLRNVLPPGFGNAWAVTAKRSYPFLNEPDIDFAAPLATLVKTGRVYTFLPTGQHDKSQYVSPPTRADPFSLAAVYAMIARAIGVTDDVAALKNTKIDRFWNDTKRIAVWRGPATTQATLGALKPIAANARLNNANVIGEMKIGRLVILRGSHTKNNGAKAEHWLLGTLYTASGNALNAVIANDPWTGMQVTIDPATKKVIWPANYALTGFKIDGYQPVTLK